MWIGLLACLGFQTLRAHRDGAFCAQAEITYAALLEGALRNTSIRTVIDSTIDALVDTGYTQEREAETCHQTAERHWEEITKATEALRQLDLGRDGLTANAVQVALDIGPRYEAFKLATHYWEARYLAEVEEGLQHAAALDDAKSPTKLERQYRRLAKLFPCFVATLFTLPHRFIGWNQKDLPLFGAIDLLIVDDALIGFQGRGI